MSPETARSLIDALDGGTNLPRRRTDLLRTRDAEMLASDIAQSVVVDVFATRNPLAASSRLHLTGESAFDQITSGLGDALVGTAREVHGYLPAASLEDLIDDAMLVRSDEGAVHVYRFRDGKFPWGETPATLVAIDATRSLNSRVRTSGLEALEEKRNRWLAKNTS